MTTKKTKKKDSTTLEMPGTIGSAKVVLPTEKKSKKKIDPDLSVYNDERLVSKHDKKQLANKSSGGWPKISQGTHLTVKTFEDGHTELVWDDEQLLKEVQEAIASVSTTEAKPKRKTKEKK